MTVTRLLMLALSAALWSPGATWTTQQQNFSVQHHHRHEKFFPIYTVVRFSHSQCPATNGALGTCYLKSECTNEGGTRFGTCARRLGVCCVVTRNCTGTLTKSNNTYFQNPGFPLTYGGGTRCTLSVNKTSDSVCYLRLSFTLFTLAQPDQSGVCSNDSLVVTGTDTVIPRLCGINTGQHVYLKFRSDGSPIQVTIITNASVDIQRQWDILVSQHDCTQGPPNNCLQYHTSLQGTVSSFNYGDTVPAFSTRQLVDQQYGVCVRPGDGHCGIQWSQASRDSFTVSNDTIGAGELVGMAESAEQGDRCIGDFVIIPNAMRNGVAIGSDRLCGNALPPTTSMMTPMILTVVNDGSELLSPEAQDIGNRGFRIAYRQVECT